MQTSPGYICPPLAGIMAAGFRFRDTRYRRFGDGPFAFIR